ncbi:MAG: hypothetical protein R3E08_14275 [Thiotrichaceae bacterium]
MYCHINRLDHKNLDECSTATLKILRLHILLALLNVSFFNIPSTNFLYFIIMESQFIPYSVTTVPAGRTLILAPYPDDEVFGCGGAIMQHVAQNDEIAVMALTGRACSN